MLQILAARLLGMEGLGVFSALFAVIVLATAVSSGFVGDSLTVLDRTDPPTRAALQGWCLLIAGGSGLIAGTGSWALGFLSWSAAAAFGAALTMFVFEDLLRRVLMATMRFWRIVVVDLAGLAGAVVVLVGLRAVGSGPVTITDFMITMMSGQLLAILVAVFLLPKTERHWARSRNAGWGQVAAYGSWRALQQAVRPALLAAVRVVALIAVGLAAVGELEAARIYMAPAMLIVAGVSSYLFASYAADQSVDLRSHLRLADRSVAGLLIVVVLFIAAAVALLPWLGPLITGASYELPLPAVIGWGLYAASVAAVTPYGQLAAVRGRQRAVLGWRVADSVLSLGIVLVVVLVDGSTDWIPLSLAIGSLAGGIALRQVVLRTELARHAEEARNDR